MLLVLIIGPLIAIYVAVIGMCRAAHAGDLQLEVNAAHLREAFAAYRVTRRAADDGRLTGLTR
jgi:hypothetical protein